MQPRDVDAVAERRGAVLLVVGERGRRTAEVTRDHSLREERGGGSVRVGISMDTR